MVAPLMIALAVLRWRGQRAEVLHWTKQLVEVLGCSTRQGVQVSVMVEELATRARRPLKIAG